MDYIGQSVEELERLAAAKDGQALCELGHRYRYGKGGVEQNYTLAYRMYHKAEKLNMKDAFIALGQMYENGEYFGKNIQIAEDYYKKALSAQDNMDDNQSGSFTHPQESATNNQIYRKQSATEVKKEIQQLLSNAENERQKGDVFSAKTYVQKASDKLTQYRNILTSDLLELEAEINWIYAYIAFNEQKYADFEKYIFRKAVLEYHPWGNYLLTVVHRMINADNKILFQDMQNMLNVLNNSRMQESELGDVLGMLGDLCMEGITNGGVDPVQQAYEFYDNAANMGNIYAKEQKNKFHRNVLGKLTYHE